jgi:hypothetical protein|tara:strand:+ start:200 stop:442 length:243 start_codon:yes stop_codon:yes gene_type:complete
MGGRSVFAIVLLCGIHLFVLDPPIIGGGLGGVSFYIPTISRRNARRTSLTSTYNVSMKIEKLMVLRRRITNGNIKDIPVI